MAGPQVSAQTQLGWTKAGVEPQWTRGCVMTYDVARQRVVLFEGEPQNTWEWDGRNWNRRSPRNSPGARWWGHAMAYDTARQRVVLFGGAGNGWLTDTWEWDGNKWTQQSATINPGKGNGHAMAYDIARQRMVLFVGTGGTWHYGRPAVMQAVGTPCAGNSHTPILTSDRPSLAHPAFGFDLVGARPVSPCAFGLSARRQDRAIPPCTLYLRDPILPLLAVTNWAGFAASQRFALPLDINLCGLTFYTQGFVVDPQGPVAGLAFSNGLKLVVGD